MCSLSQEFHECCHPPVSVPFRRRFPFKLALVEIVGPFEVEPPSNPRCPSFSLRGIALADSVALDPHKWLFAPPDAGCILVRDDAALRRAFMLHSEYTTVTETDPIERYAFFDRGLEMSRRFRGLKIWMILKYRGVDAIADVIARNIATRAYLDSRIAAEPRLESLGSELSIACFRYLPEDAAVDADVLNRRIIERILDEAECYMSPTELDGRYALRVCIVNFRTQPSDIDFLLERVLSLGRAAESALRSDGQT